MEHQQEIGGAQALLSLGTKLKDGVEDDGSGSIEISSDAHGDDDFDSKSQQINDAVEAAVMRYVGGTFDKSVNNTGNKRGHTEININDFNQWILDDNINNINNIESFDNIKSKKRKLQNVDPELTGLEAEHDQLVEEAILNARELTKHIHDDFQHHHSHDDNSDISAITQLAQAATSLTGDKKATKKSQARPPEKQQQDKLKFKHLTNIETLIEEASIEACNWYNSQPSFTDKGPRVFSEVEINAVDHFISGYCHLYNLTRQDICNRIWSSERKKDNFWESLTRVLPYRSRASIYKHVRRQYHIFDVRAKWSKEDDELLRKLALSQEGRWKEIGDSMGRMPEDCRDRWRNYVKCGENRSLNKWSEAEEKQLTDIVTEFIQNSKEKKPTINWTIVSDRMKGVRSRIQCRYKWNKLIKRESSLRATYMSFDTKMWLLYKLQHYNTHEAIDWVLIARQYEEEFKHKREDDKYEWGVSDFKAGFDLMRSESGDLRGYSANFPQYISKLINERSFTEPLESELKPKASQDPTTIATATVAAVTTTVDDDGTQPQEYSLWR